MLKLEVGIMGQGKPIGRPVRRVIRSLHHFASILESRNLAPSIKEAVLKVASKYPEGALDHVFTNLDSVIQQCTAKINANRPTIPGDIIPDTPPPEEKHVMGEEPQVFMPPEPTPEPTKPAKPVLPPKPQVTRQSLFDETEKPKWTTAPASQVTDARAKENQPKEKMTNPMTQMSMEQFEAMFDMIAEREPPREGNSKGDKNES